MHPAEMVLCKQQVRRRLRGVVSPEPSKRNQENGSNSGNFYFSTANLALKSRVGEGGMGDLARRLRRLENFLDLEFSGR